MEQMVRFGRKQPTLLYICAPFFGAKMNEYIFKQLILLSKKASDANEMPVAAIICEESGKIVSKAYNKRNKSNLTIDHAEINAINKANKKLSTWRLNKCSMYVTLEPCDMCKTVIKESRIKNVYYLINRLPEKKQYNRVKIQKFEDTPTEYINEYKKILSNFWKNKRK